MMNIFQIFSVLRKKRLKGMFSIYKRIFSLAKSEASRLIPACLLLLLGVAVSLIMPRILGFIVNALTEKDFASMARLGPWLVAIVVVSGVAQLFQAYLFLMAGLRIVAGLTKTAYNKILNQELGFFDERQTGELLSRLSADTASLRSAVSANLGMFLRSLVMLVGAVALLIYTSPELSVYAFIIVPFITGGVMFFGRIIRRISVKIQDELAEANATAEESISGVRTVRSFAQEPREIDRYGGRIDVALGSMRKRAIYVSFFSSFIRFTSLGVIVVVFWLGASQVRSGVLTAGDLVAFLIYAFMVSSQLSSISGLLTDYMRAAGSAQRLFEILDREPAIPLRGGERLDTIEGLIEYRDVSFAYPSRPDSLALKNISLTIQPGEILALVGPSGSGKSTIANLAMRFYDPNEGVVLLDGRPLTDLDPSWLHEQVGYVSQEPALFSSSVAENIGYGVGGYTMEEIVEAANLANAHEFIDIFPQGYETEVGERGARLSGGQKQRIAIARAVLKNPKLLIFDEATSALDAESEYLVKQALDRLMQGRTTLVIAHRLSTVKDANRVAVLDAGQLIEIGSHDELMALEDGVYRKLVERQYFLNEDAETVS